MLVEEKTSIYLAVELSLVEISNVCTRTRSWAYANDAKIVRSRDVQCNAKESPQKKRGASISVHESTQLSLLRELRPSPFLVTRDTRKLFKNMEQLNRSFIFVSLFS